MSEKTKVFRYSPKSEYKKTSVKKRRVVSKDERVLIASKTNFRCGYCGCDLPERFHLDHVVAHKRSQSNCNTENLMASCPQCNNFKSTFSLGEFRNELIMQVDRARKYSVNFRMSEKYGLIKITPTRIIFYFETLET